MYETKTTTQELQQRRQRIVETQNTDSAEVADTPKRMWRRRTATSALEGGFASLLNWFHRLFEQMIPILPGFQRSRAEAYILVRVVRPH